LQTFYQFNVDRHTSATNAGHTLLDVKQLWQQNLCKVHPVASPQPIFKTCQIRLDNVELVEWLSWKWSPLQVSVH